MKKILLIDCDSTIPNLALMRLSTYFKKNGDSVTLVKLGIPVYGKPKEKQVNCNGYDLAYISAIFSTTPEHLEIIEGGCKVDYGGTGFDIKKKLPQEINKCKPDYSIYPDNDTFYDFISRGCFRNCHFCLTPDTQIITDRGLKQICQVKIGDMVLTHKGRYREVIKLFEREYEGDIFYIQSDATSKLFPTGITGEHQVWSRRISYRSGGQKLTTFKWIEANLLKKQNTQRSRNSIAYPRTLETKSINGAPNANWLPVNDFLMNIIGWYLSEGYLTKNSDRGYYRTTFCLGHSEKEMSYAQEIVNSSNKLKIRAKIYKTKIGIRVVIDNVKLSRWLLEQFGEGASKKHIPLWVRQLPNNLLEILITAWANGDGWTYNKHGTPTTKITTVSPNLSISLREISMKCGYICRINHGNISSTGSILGRKVNLHAAYTNIFHKQSSNVRKSTTCDEQYLYTRPTNSEIKSYIGNVYNLEVEEDNSYCTVSFPVHNCVVPQKEGNIHCEVKSVIYLLDPDYNYKKIKFLDNNFLGLIDHKKFLRELVNLQFACQFNQGLDIRLIDDENAKLLSELNYIGEYIFAFDNIKDQKLIEEKLAIVKKYISQPWKIKFFLYCHPDMDIINDVYYRILWCKEHKVLPYFMRDLTCWQSENTKTYMDFSAWCNQPGIFKYNDFKAFCIKRRPKIPYPDCCPKWFLELEKKNGM